MVDSRRRAPSVSAAGLCGEVRKGNDGEAYVSKRMKNGVCRWTKLPVVTDEFRKRFRSAKKELAKSGVGLYQYRHFPVAASGGAVYVIDDVWDWAKEKMGDDYMDKKWIIFAVKPSGVTRDSVMEKELFAQHTLTGRDKSIGAILEKHFGYAFEWTGKSTRAMKIKL